MVANGVSACNPESGCLGLLWKRLPFHTGLNEGAGHMDGRGGAGWRQRGRRHKMRKDEEGENGMRWLGEMGKGKETR